MKTRAGILWGVGEKWSVEEIDLDPPKAGEVLVKLAASGMCHSDEHLVTGDLPVPSFPYIGGHEGAGVIEEVGPGVSELLPGDHVVLGFIPACGRCPSCATGHSNLCDLGMYTLEGWQPTDQTARHRARGQDARLMCMLGTFSPYTVVSVASAIKIEPHIPLDKAALVGCGVTTGWGSSVYAADVRAGDTVVVIGAGGIGMNAIQGARYAGARTVIAVDPVEFKRDQALTFGATHTTTDIGSVFPLLQELTRGALADKVIITPGLAVGDMIAGVMALVAKNGVAVVTALGAMTDVNVTMSLLDLTLFQKTLKGAIFGSANPRFDIPRLLSLYEAGQLKLDELITREYSLDQINEGYQDMRDGHNIRGLIRFE